jgi:hypothetical protein
VEAAPGSDSSGRAPGTRRRVLIVGRDACEPASHKARRRLPSYTTSSGTGNCPCNAVNAEYRK